jgi:nucleotide-binding universal stress UspA family protein
LSDGGKEEAMTAIVVGLDASADSAAALRWAAEEARSRAATLVTVHAYWVPLTYVQDDRTVRRMDPDLHRQAEEALDRSLRGAEASLADLEVERRLRPGRAAPALIEEAGTADLLVIGRRGAGGFEGLLLGSTAEHCARHSPSPTVVVSAPLRPPRGRVVVGVDGSMQAQRALAWAVEHAARREARVEVLGVYETYSAPGPYGGEFMRIASPESEQRFRRRVERVTAESLAAVDVPTGVAVDTSVEAGHPANVLIERSTEADLVVVGSRGLGGFSGLLLGSVSRQLLHHGASPVAVVRDRG